MRRSSFASSTITYSRLLACMVALKSQQNLPLTIKTLIASVTMNPVTMNPVAFLAR